MAKFMCMQPGAATAAQGNIEIQGEGKNSEMSVEKGNRADMYAGWRECAGRLRRG
jgi:hypothetical protein